MTDSLAVAEAFTLLGEEGRQTAPLAGDPGAATNWGITLATLSAWRGRICAADEVYALTYQEASAIFHGWYWNALRCWGLWPGIDLMVADHGFNCGAAAAARVLQTLLAVDVDLRIGPVTIAATRMIVAAGRAAFLDRLRLAQETDYRRKADFPTFGREWIGDLNGRDEWHRLGRLGRRHQAALTLLGAQPQPLSGGTAPT